jgi:Ca2+-binding RTX toxin-like protein
MKFRSWHIFPFIFLLLVFLAASGGADSPVAWPNARGFCDLLRDRVKNPLICARYPGDSFTVGLKADEHVSAGIVKPGSSSMAIITVSTSADLVKAIKSASDGDVIQLGAGNYGKVSLSGVHFASGVTITSADPDNPAVLSGLKISGSSGLDFSNIEFALTPADKYFPITVGTSSDVHFSGLDVHGIVGGDISNQAMAMMIRGSSNVSVADSEFQSLHHGINFLDSDHLSFTGNSIHDIRADGIRGGGSSDVAISGNYLTSFYPAAGDHPDAIQLWTTGTDASARNIVISGNVVTRGEGDFVQGIFLRDQSGGKLPYQNVTISDNIVLGGMYNGISIGNANGLVMTDNVVGAFADQKSWLRIDNSTGVEMTGNSASAYILTNDSYTANFGNSATGPVAGTGEDVLKTWLNANQGLWEGLPESLISAYFPAGAAMSCASTVVGTAGADKLCVNASTSTHVQTGAGNDVLTGGAAASTEANLLEGGAGDDVYVIGNKLDRVVEAVGGGTDEVQARVDHILGAHVENLRMLEGAVAGTGNDLANVIRGNDASNVIKALGGDDLVYGGGGNDKIYGGDGNDRLYGDAGNDIVQGGAGNDRLYGGDGDDIIYGGAGDDLIEGGMGSDTLYGGTGADQFSYRPEHLLGAGTGKDSIADFSSAQGDRILLAMLDANSQTVVNDKFSFIGTNSFSGEAGQLRYSISGGNAYVCGDVNGDGAADFTLCVAGVTSLGADDFSL